MAKQTTLWTALPNGYTDDHRSLRISLLVTPRLEPDADRRLKAFPDFADWPATLRQSRFELRFGAGPTVTINGNVVTGRTRIDDRLGMPDSAIWQALFPPETLVHGFEWRDLSKHGVLSFPAADLDNKIRELYSDLAASSLDQLPTAGTFLTNPKWAELLNAVQEHDDRYTDKEKKSGIRDTGRQFREFLNEREVFRRRDLQTSLARFELFHTPPSPPKVERYADAKPNEAKSAAEWLSHEQTPLPKAEAFRDEIDFHRMVSAMNQYPTLLRSLGLVVDVLVARDRFTPSAGALLSVTVHLPPATPDVTRPDHDASPRTRARLDDLKFQPVSAPAPDPGDFRIADGLLSLDPKTFKLLQADVDGGTSKLMNFSRSLNILREKPLQQVDPVTRKKREIGAPAIRNAGLMLVHDSRGDKLRKILDRQDRFNADAMKIQQGVASPPPPPEMFAEDLVRGYRIDIWDDVSRTWHSLCQRKSIYDIASGEIVIDVPSEEGTVRLAATTSPNKNSNPNIIWLHEALVSWTGWSLCAPPPGKTIHHKTKDIDDDGNEVIVHQDPVGEPEAEVPPGLRLESTFRALPGTLPRLRYGRAYWLRARAVDLAGNSLAPQSGDFGPEKPADNQRGYFRFDPISAPALALVKPTSDSTEFPAEGESMDLMAIRTFNETPDLNLVPTTATTRRFAVPSRTTHREAEQHGMLDRNGVVDPTFFATLAAQDNSLTREEMLGPMPMPGDEEVKPSYAVMIDGAPLPYLPDPLAVEISARILGHPTFTDEPVIRIPFYAGTEWPEALPFKIEIYENPGDVPRYDDAARTLLIPLPKAERATLRLSVRPTRRALSMLGVWNWLTLAQQTKTIVINGQSMTLERLARTGQHWMLTPWRNVELVHAVQRPLITPQMTKLEIFRDEDKTYARPFFTTTCSIPSTDRLDFRAAWNEPFDDGPDNPLGNRPRIDHAFSVKITDKQDYADQPEYLQEPNPNLIKVPALTFAVQGNERGAKLHEFHDTRYRRIEYWLEGTSKFREFMPPGYLFDEDAKPTEERINVVGPRKRRWIPSSSAPPAPEVLYVVPTFGWVRSGDDTTRSSWRRGGGLRVYLNRPWNTSGYGEMLAVVLPNANVVDPNVEPALRPMKNFVTQWGNDPIWESTFVPGVAPKAANFPLARTKGDPDGKWLPSFAPIEEADQPPEPFKTTSLSLPELRSGPALSRVDIAPHDVFYDDSRQLWYCDIEVDFIGAYYPFIRLALARYQPTSLDSLHLSSAVLADFMQLVPDRWLNVTHTRDPRTRNVRVFGHTYTESSGRREVRTITPERIVLGAAKVSPTSVVEVWVEYLDSSLGEDFGWKRETGAIVRDDLAEPVADSDFTRNVTLTQRRARAKDLMIQREFEAVLEESLIDQVFISPTLWKGSVTLPVVPASGFARRHRLAVAEYEEYLVDDDVDGRGGDAYDRILESKDRRLVFMEYVELN